MPRRSSRSMDEFPNLTSNRLYPAEIRGDGNCLFNALSDQMFGNQSRHAEIRATVIAYMRANAAYFKAFVIVKPTRRNPKRKNAGVFSVAPIPEVPTEAAIDAAFAAHLADMAKGGTWGDSLELKAFVDAYGINVKVWQSTGELSVESCKKTTKSAHIAYHHWQHYSSVRNVDGPHTGLPNVDASAVGKDGSPEPRQYQMVVVTRQMVEKVRMALPFGVDSLLVKKMLEEAKGDAQLAAARLVDLEDRGSISTQSSVERDVDSDEEEEIWGPNKRATRNRLARQKQRASADPTQHAFKNDAATKTTTKKTGPRNVAVPKTRKARKLVRRQTIDKSVAALSPSPDITAVSAPAPASPPQAAAPPTAASTPITPKHFTAPLLSDNTPGQAFSSPLPVRSRWTPPNARASSAPRPVTTYRQFSIQEVAAMLAIRVPGART
ncbi:cysteine proteinase [Trichodelitschia bisporula]|uniref:Cysteine proteinase n=1 Tax=Trichodelitschia bisporula TaxID=703511 RepID=A0A6G1HKV2_9PEZI|nr:cysteine proteinase [Trichodelitschia bisporula]